MRKNERYSRLQAAKKKTQVKLGSRSRVGESKNKEPGAVYAKKRKKGEYFKERANVMPTRHGGKTEIVQRSKRRGTC